MSEKINIVIAAQTGAAVKGLDSVSKSTQRVGTSVQNAQSKMRTFNSSVTAGNVNMRKFAMGGLQQAGYQIGDYAVQVANGTSKMQAFGQQAPQLLQIFGPIGSILGAATAIFAAFYVALDRSTVSTKDAANAFENLHSKMLNLKSSTDALSTVSAIIKKEFRGSAEEVQALIDSLVELERVEVLKKLADGFYPVNQEIETYFKYMDQISSINKRIDLTPPTNKSRLIELNRLLDIAKTNMTDMGRSFPDVAKVFNSMQSAMRETDPKKLVQGLALIKADAELVGGTLGPMISAVIDEAAQSAGILDSMLSQAAESTKDTTDEYVYQDAVLRQLNIKTSNMSVLAGQMKTAQSERLKMMQDEDALMSQLVVKGAVYAKSAYQGGRGGDPRQFTTLDELRKQLTDLNTASEKLGDKASSSIKKIAVTVNKELSPEMKRLKSVQESVSSSFESGFMSMIDGTASFKDAFKSMASEIIKELYRIFVVKRITGFIADAIGGIGGGVTTSARPVARPPSLDGGGYTGGGARSGGLDGKGGFMAMLHPRETVIDHTKGQGSGGVVVNQTINVSTGVQQTVRTEIKTLMPQIAEAAKSAVADAKRRGGSYGRAMA